MDLQELKAEAQKALRAGEHGHALTLIDKALVIRPGEPRLTDAYARALLAKGELDRAEAWAEELIASSSPRITVGPHDRPYDVSRRLHPPKNDRPFRNGLDHDRQVF